jgi:NAD(P)H-hydrate repair Nnr-like enzyme with NAD(P)H-hydrate dehydratase domain
MPNDQDQDRLSDKTAGAQVIDIDAARAARDQMNAFGLLTGVRDVVAESNTTQILVAVAVLCALLFAAFRFAR